MLLVAMHLILKKHKHLEYSYITKIYFVSDILWLSNLAKEQIKAHVCSAAERVFPPGVLYNRKVNIKKEFY
jgi:hypothetical protein